MLSLLLHDIRDDLWRSQWLNRTICRAGQDLVQCLCAERLIFHENHLQNHQAPELIMRGLLLTSSLVACGLSVSQSAAIAPFSIQQQDGAAWLVRPNGERFFSFGACVVDQGASLSEYNPTNPGYAAFQHYENSNRWAAATVQRLRSWKFTTIGAWSDFDTLKQCHDGVMAFTPMLAVGMTCGAPWVDMWDTNVIARMHEVARKQILPLRDDPRLLGYYSDNEMGWWNAPLFKMTLEQAPISGQRRRLLQL